MADVQLDFSLDVDTTIDNIEKQLTKVIDGINNSGILKFSAQLDETSLSKIKSQLDSLSTGESKSKATFDTDKLALYTTKIDKAKESIKGLQANISSLKNPNIDISKITGQLSVVENALSKAKNVDLSQEDKAAALNQVKTALTQLNAEISKTSAEYNNLAQAERRATNKDNNDISKINKSITKYNQLTDYMKKYESALKRNPDLWNKGQELLQSFKSGELATKGIREQERAFLQFRQSCIDSGIEVDSLGTKLKNLFTQHLDTAIAMAGIHALQQALQQVYQNVVQLDSAVTDLQIASGYSRTQTKELVSEYSSLAQQLGSTTTEVANAADGWMRQGYDVTQTNELVTDSMMLSKLGQMESADATTALTSALKGYKLEVSDGADVVSKLTAVDMEAAASAGGIATAMSECATSANLAGVSMNDLIGYLAEIKQVTQDSDELSPTMVRQSA